jgi:DNA-binding FadR family transcriptional regulator
MAPYVPTPIKRDSVISKAAEELCRLIEAERLRPGARLPTETQLSRMLGISRNSLREAFRILDGLGFVEKRAGRGIVVRVNLGEPHDAAVDSSAAVDVAPVAFQVRMIVESHCAALAARSGNEGDVAEMEGQMHLLEEALKRGDLVAATQAHLSFHDVLVRAARHPLLAALYHQIRFIITEIGRRGAQKTYKNRRHLAAHWDIHRAVARRDPEKAVAAVERHFQTIGPLIEFMSKNQGAVQLVVSPQDPRP